MPLSPRLLGAALAWLLAAGCTPGLDVAGYPLYPDPAVRRPRDEVARLFGAIGSVDGRDVSSLGDAYEVLPGCHELITRNAPLESTTYVTVTGSVGARYFVLPMRAGFSYVLKREAQSPLGTSAVGPVGVGVFAEEFDARGVSVQVIYPAHPGDLVTCQERWQATR